MVTIYNRYNNIIEIDYKTIINEVVQKTLIHENFKCDFELYVSIVDNQEIKAINSKFRNLDKATDVLTFPLLQEIKISTNNEAIELGDIIISWDKVLKQSKEYGHTIKRELAFLVAHSVLHILGYDHLTDKDYEIMDTKQNSILNSLNINR